MKKIIFFLLVLNSFVFGAYNSSTDFLYYYSSQIEQCKLATIPYNTLTVSDSTSMVKYTNQLYTNYCTDATLTYHAKFTVTYYKWYTNYDCPIDGQEIIGGVCATPPTCSAGSVWNSTTDTCVTADSDGDGTPDKCDKDSVNFDSLDCNDDGENNYYDSDIDGDGVPNSTDANPYDKTNLQTCSITNLTLLTGHTSSSCQLSLFPPVDGKTYLISQAEWDSCRGVCGIKISYCPKGQAVKNGECRSVEPDISDCQGTSQCQTLGVGMDGIGSTCWRKCYCLTTSSPVPDLNNVYFSEEVSCTDTQTDKEKLDILKNDSDVNTSVNKLDINGTANLDSAASFKAALDSYAGSKETTALEQLKQLGIQSLQAVLTNTNLDKLNSLVENFSAVSTSNDGIINGTLNGIKSGIETGLTIGNNLLSGIKDGVDTAGKTLTDIKDLLSGDSNSSSSDYSESDAQSVDRKAVDGKLSSAYEFLNNVKNDFDNIKNMLDGGLPVVSMSSGTSPSWCITVFGQRICINLCESFGQFYSIFYYIFSLLFMFASLRIYYHAFKMRI